MVALASTASPVQSVRRMALPDGAERSQLVRRVLKAYPHLGPLAPAHLFADAGEPEPYDRSG